MLKPASSGPAGHQSTWNTYQIAPDRAFENQLVRAKDTFDLLRLASSQFDNDRASRPQQPWGIARNLSIRFEAISAAVKRKQWVMLAHLALQRSDLAGCNVRRIADDQIETGVEREAIIANSKRRAILQA